ncbi:hypothetical protein M8J77_001182 [Diaphorina citri]|nr:hypothetical protein M8J77_001182 [Diaphorina citri]
MVGSSSQDNLECGVCCCSPQRDITCFSQGPSTSKPQVKQSTFNCSFTVGSFVDILPARLDFANPLCPSEENQAYRKARERQEFKAQRNSAPPLTRFH